MIRLSRNTLRSVVTVFARVTATALFSIACTSAHADIISDGGFESAGGGNLYFAGQTIDGGSWTVSQGAVFIDSMDPYVCNGNNSLNLTLGNLYVPNAITQTLSTTAGQQYVLSFYADADAANAFSILVNGALLAGGPGSIAQNGFPLATSNGSLFVNYQDGFLASSGSTTLTFLATASPVIGSSAGSVLVDNVTASPTANAVTPEPSSVTLVLTGLTGLGEFIRRKRSKRC